MNEGVHWGRLVEPRRETEANLVANECEDRKGSFGIARTRSGERRGHVRQIVTCLRPIERSNECPTAELLNVRFPHLLMDGVANVKRPRIDSEVEPC
jgi:hypothetical protein